MRITDLLDDYYDTSVSIPEADAPSAERTTELIMRKVNQRKRRRIPVGILIAACLALLLSITAGAAYYMTHQSTIDLVETGPFTGGSRPVELDDASKRVIENASKDYLLTDRDGETCVTLDSVMGYYSEYFSTVYMTLTIAPPAGTEFTADLEDCGFWQYEQSLSGEAVGGDGSCTALRNEDGTISAMLMMNYRGDVNGRMLQVKLSGFGNVSKEAARELYDGTRTIEVPGTWEFSIDALDLEQPQELEFDPDAFREIGFVPKRITVSSFGGMLTVQNGAGKSIKHLAEPIVAAHPELDWDAMTAEQLNLMLASGEPFTDEETEWLSENVIPVIRGNAEIGVFDSIQVRYPDGSAYEGNTTVWSGTDEEGNVLHAFLFEAPQDLTKAEALVINGVEVPLS